MQESPKYLVHAAFRASGIVERSDVVGAVFGQTEGLLGEGLDLRDLQESSKVGRIDVALDTEAGRTYGTLTIASGLDRVETAILAAALETIERVGPARARVKVDRIEDAREAKRREVVDRAAELLADLEVESTSSRDLVAAVRERVQVADIEEYEGLPAGPRVADSDAIVVVEGRADVLTLLRYGVRNAIAAEGTDVPEVLADLTRDRTATAFLDGDRGGELICRELAQVADVDYVTFAPDGMAVEDLDREAVTDALRRKVPLESIVDEPSPRSAFYARMESDRAGGDDYSRSGTDGEQGETDAVVAESTSEADGADERGGGQPAAAAAETGEAVDEAGEGAAPSEPPARGRQSDGGAATEMAAAGGGGQATVREESSEERAEATAADTTEPGTETAEPAAGEDERERDGEEGATAPETLAGHVAAVFDRSTETVRLLDEDATLLADGAASDAVTTLETADPVPATVILDGTLTQALLDVAAQRGVTQVVARETGEFVKRPTAVRIRSPEEF